MIPRKFDPRFYQREAWQAVMWAIKNEPGCNPLVAMPTGSGKSPLIGMCTQSCMYEFPDARVLICAHVKELVKQNVRNLKMVWPNAPVGVFSSGLNKREAHAPVIVGNIQSVVRNLHLFKGIRFLIIDEAQMLSPKDGTNYQRLITHLQKSCPDLVVIGLSATPYRMKNGLLTEGEDAIFTRVVYDITSREAFVKLIEFGFLAPLVSTKTSFMMDVSGVKIQGGDFASKQLEERVNTDEYNSRAIAEALERGKDREHCLVFCAGIDHIEAVAQVLASYGETVVFVHSKMKKSERDAAIAAFEQGLVRFIVSANILRVGFDVNFVDHIILLCPTRSAGLHVQTLGRGTRPVYVSGFDLSTVGGRLESMALSCKQDCLVSDFAGNLERLGPINDVVLPKRKGKGTGEIPIKICPACDTYNHAAARFCENPSCDHEFLFKKAELTKEASTARAVATKEPDARWVAVKRVEYSPFQVYKADLAMRVEYITDAQKRVTELVRIEGPYWAIRVAKEWWKKRLPDFPPPPDTERGLTAVHMLKTPTHIYVNFSNKKRPTISAVSFDGTTPMYGPKKELENG